LTIDLAIVADGLILKCRSNVSDLEYHKIMAKDSDVEKMSLLLEAICARRDGIMFKKFCQAVEEVKFQEWAKILRSFL